MFFAILEVFFAALSGEVFLKFYLTIDQAVVNRSISAFRL